MKQWLFHRIYGDPSSDSWYYDLLNSVVAPFTGETGERIDKFFFLQYYPEPEPEPNCDPPDLPPTPAAFIRLRVRAEEEELESLANDLRNYAVASPAVTSVHRCPYDVQADLGQRFSLADPEPVIAFLDAASRLALVFRQPGGGFDANKVITALHLAANTFDYHVMVGTWVGSQGSIIQTGLP